MSWLMFSRRNQLKDLWHEHQRTERSEASNLEKADAVGAALGFIPRENTRAAAFRKRKEIGPTVAINMRVPEAVAARFIGFCEQHRLSYWEGVDELMKRSRID